MTKDLDILVLPDLHFPYEDTRTLAAVEKVMAEYKWDEVIQLGDFMDFDCISSHNFGKLRTIAGKTLQSDYAVANRALDRWQKLTGKAKWTILEGNHDERLLRYIDANPQLEGSIEVPMALHLKDRGIQWVPSWSKGELYRVGNAHFLHGKYTNEHHAKKMVSRYGVNVFYGHLHDVQCFPLVLHGEDKTIVGQSLGCLCDYRQQYMKNSPSNWQQAFAVFHVWADGFFQYDVVRIFKHRFHFRGKTYAG